MNSNKETKVLDEALAYLNGDIESVNESVLAIIGGILMAPYVIMMAILFISLPAMLIDSLNKNKLFSKNRKFFDALNKFSYKYAEALRKAMPKYGKYIDPNKITKAGDIHVWNTKEKYFGVSALSFDIAGLKRDTKDSINWEYIHYMYELYADDDEVYDEDSALDDYLSSFDLTDEEITGLKESWPKVIELKNEARKEYYTAVKEVREYFNTNGCPSVISFELLGSTEGDMKYEYKKFDEIFIGCCMYPESKTFNLGYINIYYNKGLDRVKMPEKLREEIKSKIEKK